MEGGSPRVFQQTVLSFFFVLSGVIHLLKDKSVVVYLNKGEKGTRGLGKGRFLKAFEYLKRKQQTSPEPLAEVAQWFLQASKKAPLGE